MQSVVRAAFAEAAQWTQGDFVLQQGIHPAAAIASEEAPHRNWGDWGTHGGHSDTAGTLRLRRKLTDTLSGQTS